MSSTYILSALRRLVCDRAKGCCEYCLIPEATAFVPHEIDHIIAEKHGGLTEADNLALSYTLCNKHKGSDIASIDSETAITAIAHTYYLSIGGSLNGAIAPLQHKGLIYGSEQGYRLALPLFALWLRQRLS